MAKFDKVADSGKNQEFITGAVRDNQDNKPRPDLISPIFLIGVGNANVNNTVDSINTNRNDMQVFIF